MRRSPLASLSSFTLVPSKSWTLVLCVLIFSTFAVAAPPDRITTAVDSSQIIRLSGGVPQRAQPLFDRGPVEPSFKLGYMTLLTIPSASQQRAIDQLLAQQQDPHSPQYHKWLTPEQYADRFGLSSNDLTKITVWLKSQGFDIVRVARARNFVVFSGTAAQVESTFQTPIHTFENDSEKHFSNTSSPSIPAALSGVVIGIRGLSNFRPKSNAVHAKPDLARPDYTTSGGYLYLAPGDIATIYDLTPLYTAGYTGSGQTLAVMGQTDVYLADLNDFRSGFGLSSISGCTTNSKNIITACNSTYFKYVLVNSDPGSPTSGDLGEADIDIEWSGAVAQKAQILYVNAPDPSGNGVWDSWYYAVDNNLAPVITMSYTAPCELAEAEFATSGVGSFTADEAELKAANAEGITFLNSSGDGGAAECDYSTNYPINGYAVAYPASSPEVTGVGGTLLSYPDYTSTYWKTSNNTNGGSALSYMPEAAWNDAQEWSEYCTAVPSDPACSGNPGLNSWATAQESYVGVVAGGGGLSNCFKETGGVCAAPPNGGFAQPAWQQSLSIPSQTTAVRLSPDVSLLASVYWPGFIVCTPVEEVTQGSTNTASTCAGGISSAISTYSSIFGGTSISSPMFAGIVTLLNHYLVKNGVQSAAGLGNINPNLYQIAAVNPSAFHQVTVGSIGVFCQPGTPTNQPAVLQCPSSGATPGFLGFDASNFDTTTGYNLATGLGSVDANVLATVWESSKTVPSVTISASPNSIAYGKSVLLTATVSTSATAGAATGTVTFLNNASTTLGTGTLDSSGVATLSTTSLPSGTDHITASYAGDLYNQPFTSPTAAIVTVTAPTFTWTTSSTSHSVLAGQTTLAYSFTVTPTSDNSFVGGVTFGCAFAPADSTLTNSSCVFSPASIAAGTSSPSGTPVTLKITTKGPNTGTGSQLRQRSEKRSPWLPLALPVAGMIMLGVIGGAASGKVAKSTAVALLCLSLVLAGIMLACGGGGGSTPPPPISVSVTPSSAVQLYANEAGNMWPSATQQQFSALVNNSTNQSVTWSVASSADGSVDSTGLYTAPVTVPSPATVSVTATAAADATKSGSGTVSILAPTAVGAFTVTVSATETGATAPISRNVTLNVQ
jgi:subtilase family serine protease